MRSTWARTMLLSKEQPAPQQYITLHHVNCCHQQMVIQFKQTYSDGQRCMASISWQSCQFACADFRMTETQMAEQRHLQPCLTVQRLWE